jgi:hypothetical protein
VLECLLLGPSKLFIVTASLRCSCCSNSLCGWPDARAGLQASYLYNFKAVGCTGFREIKKHPSLYEVILMDMNLVTLVTALKHGCNYVCTACSQQQQQQQQSLCFLTVYCIYVLRMIFGTHNSATIIDEIYKE